MKSANPVRISGAGPEKRKTPALKISRAFCPPSPVRFHPFRKSQRNLSANLKTAQGFDKVLDVTIHPTEGKVLGVWMQAPSGERSFLPPQQLNTQARADKSRQDSFGSGANMDRTGGRLVTREILGISVITESGKLLGHVSDVYIPLDRPSVIYRVVESEWQESLGKGLYLDGSQAVAYSRFRWRLTVPDNVVTWRDLSSGLKSGSGPAISNSLKTLHLRKFSAAHELSRWQC